MKKRRQIAVSLDPQLIEKIEQAAAEAGRTRSNMIEHLLTKATAAAAAAEAAVESPWDLLAEAAAAAKAEEKEEVDHE